MQRLRKQKEEDFGTTSSMNATTAASFAIRSTNIVCLIYIYHPPQQLFPVIIMELMDENLH